MHQYAINIGSLKGRNMENINAAQSRAAPYTGVTVFFNPHWIAEIKIATRTLEIIRHRQRRQCRQRAVIINTIYLTYHIPVRWWIERCNPASCAVVFSDFVKWHHNLENGEHVFWCKKQPKFLKEVIFGDSSMQRNKHIAFTYLDIERIEDRTGTILWQKKR